MKGFVDLQVNGYLGVDFAKPGLSLDEVRLVVESLRRTGTIAFCPTVITSSMDTYESNLPVLARALREPDLAPHFLGIHLEGPFMSPEPGARGAHPPQHMKDPDPRLYDHLRDLAEGQVSLVTVAPERPGGLDFIRYLRSSRVVVSLGHHLADRETVRRACRAGATGSTHLGNGIPNTLPRHPNPIWSQLDEEGLAAMVITDGHHVPDEFTRSVLRAKGIENTIVVSDAAPIAGMPPGTYQTLGQEVVLEESGKLWNPVGNFLVGSSYNMTQCMNHLAEVTRLAESDLIRLGHTNPLRFIGRSLDERALAAFPDLRFEERRFTVPVLED